jgi:nicotinate-nucleotide adenylyltransferase
MRRVGVFGGTFDPVHWGHLLVAQTAFSQLPLDEVIWIPTLNPPYKQTATRLSQRLEMVKLAIASHPNFSTLPINNLESVDTIDAAIAIQDIYTQTRWYWILGIDAFATLPRWRRSKEIASAYEWIVVPRIENSQIPQQVAQQFENLRWQILPMPIVQISSSLIRQYCRDRYSIRYLVPEAVRSYINCHNLYSN